MNRKQRRTGGRRADAGPKSATSAVPGAFGDAAQLQHTEPSNDAGRLVAQVPAIGPRSAESSSRPRTLVFCTAWSNGVEGGIYTWKRYRLWIEAIRQSRLDFDQLMLVDDGSAELPDWPDTTIVREADGLISTAKIVLYHFETRLGRLSVTDFPGWIRSFFFPAVWAAANGFSRVIHVESDAFLISGRMQDYCNDVDEGWIAPWCPRYQWPESAIQVIAGSALRSYLVLSRHRVEEWSSRVIEKSLPFTHIETRFLGDRFGDSGDFVPRGADWTSQAHRGVDQSQDQFYWWLSGMGGNHDDPIQALPDSGPRSPSPMTGKSPMLFSELAFHTCLARPGTIIDAGANVGGFSRPFSTWERNRLIAFEPFAPVFEQLKANLTEDHAGKLPARVRLCLAALGETLGTAKIRVPSVAGAGFVHAWASLVKTFEGIDGVSVYETDVPVWTIDGLDLDDVTAIKIDVEGSEIEVLHGARRTIQRCRPIISCECEERQREGVSWYVPGFMRALGYEAWFYHQEQFWPVSSLDRRVMQVASPFGPAQSDTYIGMFMFIPRELNDLRERLSEFGPFRSA